MELRAPGQVSRFRMNVALWLVAILVAVEFSPASPGTPAIGEARAAATTFAVNSLSDPGDGVCTTDPGGCTLREALAAAFNNAGDDTITFAVSGEITIATPLVVQGEAGNAVLLDGYSAPGSSPNSIATGTNATITIHVLSTSSSAWTEVRGAATVRGLRFNNSATGDDVPNVRVWGPGAVIEGCFFGTSTTGASDHSAASPNAITIETMGLSIAIGGPGIAQRNLISGSGAGVRAPAGKGGATVVNNIIGLNGTGTVAIANRVGVLLEGDSVVVGPGNVISGNTDEGVRITGHNNRVSGNLIGLRPVGAALIGNHGPGVTVAGGALNNTIGGEAPADRNIISGNSSFGVFVTATTPSLRPGGTVIRGNCLGTNPACDDDLSVPSPGQVTAIHLSGPSDTTIDDNVALGESPFAGAIEASLGYDAGTSTFFPSEGVTITRNRVGLNDAGTQLLPQAGDGIIISHANNVRVGGSAAEGNVVSLNFGSVAIGAFPYDLGVFNARSSVGLTISGNLIGLAADGTTPLFHFGDGIYVRHAEDVLIGAGAGGLAGNTMANVDDYGIYVTGSTAGTTTVAGNHIGAGYSSGIAFSGGASQVSVTGNVITGRNDNGVVIAGDATSGIRLSENSVYGNGGLGIDLWGTGESPATVTPNDSGDADTGPNGLQNYPVVAQAQLTAGTLSINGALDGQPNTGYRIEYFVNPAGTCHPSGHGEGRTYVGFSVHTADASGQVAVNWSGLVTGAAAGDTVTATATDPSGNTSEFSACVLIEPGPPADPCPGPATIDLITGANGHVYCGAGFALVSGPPLRAPGPLPETVTALFSWDTPNQLFDFWFRGFPDGFQTLESVASGGYYFFQSSANTGTIPNTGGSTTLPGAGTTSIETVAGANGAVWAGTNHATATLATYPSIAGLTALFEWNNPGQLFRFWFRGFPDGFQTLTPGLERGRYYFFQAPSGLSIPMD